MRLLCLPYAGAGAGVFRGWLTRVPPDVEVCAAEPPGRTTRLMEPPLTRMAELVEPIARALTALGEAPLVIFGHSMGALVGFELARELRRTAGVTPQRLFVSACQAPRVARPGPPLHLLPREQLVQELVRLNGTPAAVLADAELMDLVLPAIRADFEALETYQYREEPPLACPITALGGLDDRRAPRQTLAPWRDETTETFSLQMLPGDHFFLHAFERPLVDLVVAGIAP